MAHEALKKIKVYQAPFQGEAKEIESDCMGQAATPSAAKIPSATPRGVVTEGRAPTRLGKAQVWSEPRKETK